MKVEGGTDDAKRQLYTALYHAMLQPGMFSDVEGSYLGFDKQVHVDTAHPRYANFSGWDVYRSWMPLVAVLAPREAIVFGNHGLPRTRFLEPLTAG